jgi:C-terminal processing protease CtpA/Prc
LRSGVASKDGRLEVGDVVLFVDGTNLEGMRPMEAQKLLVGPAGSTSSLQIHKAGESGGEPTTIVLRRDVGSNSSGPTAFGIVRKT